MLWALSRLLGCVIGGTASGNFELQSWNKNDESLSAKRTRHTLKKRCVENRVSKKRCVRNPYVRRCVAIPSFRLRRAPLGAQVSGAGGVFSKAQTCSQQYSSCDASHHGAVHIAKPHLQKQSWVLFPMISVGTPVGLLDARKTKNKILCSVFGLS